MGCSKSNLVQNRTDPKITRIQIPTSKMGHMNKENKKQDGDTAGGDENWTERNKLSYPLIKHWIEIRGFWLYIVVCCLVLHDCAWQLFSSARREFWCAFLIWSTIVKKKRKKSTYKEKWISKTGFYFMDLEKYKHNPTVVANIFISPFGPWVDAKTSIFFPDSYTLVVANFALLLFFLKDPANCWHFIS